MSTYSTNEFKSGLKIMIDNDPYVIVENEFVKPGKGQAFNRVRIRNLKSGRTLERSFRSGDTVEGADIQESEMQYLYSDGDFWHFMVPENFEQHTAGNVVAVHCHYFADSKSGTPGSDTYKNSHHRKSPL